MRERGGVASMWRTSSSRHEHAASSTTPRTRTAGKRGILRARDRRASEEHDVIGEIHDGGAGVAQVAKGGGLEKWLDDDPIVAPLHAHRREVHEPASSIVVMMASMITRRTPSRTSAA